MEQSANLESILANLSQSAIFLAMTLSVYRCFNDSMLEDEFIDGVELGFISSETTLEYLKSEFENHNIVSSDEQEDLKINPKYRELLKQRYEKLYP